MNSFRVTLAAGILVAAMAPGAPAHSSQDVPRPRQAAAVPAGVRDFDFLVGEWRVHHRRLKERLADSHEWLEFEGTSSHRLLMDGWANVEDHWINAPSGAYRAVGLRAYDSKTGQWAIWWLDGRDPSGDLDPPVKGRFENGVGTFYGDQVLNGKPTRIRFIWSHITPTSARWEQAYSPTAGQTWETNWTMDFRRSPLPSGPAPRS